TGVQYPEGHKFQVEGIDESLVVYEGQLVLKGQLEVPADAAAGEQDLEVKLKYQACNNENCLRPVTLTLTGKVKIATAGTQAAAINQKLFAAPEP
ncbi:MAG: hypothetical protein KDA58_14880, partial [Planctomycetaceae bacterium]|nr:hypothetical protein [Planctomycetaceae bacterium]